jgi:hypothetical protein
MQLCSKICDFAPVRTAIKRAMQLALQPTFSMGAGAIFKSVPVSI